MCWCPWTPIGSMDTSTLSLLQSVGLVGEDLHCTVVDLGSAVRFYVPKRNVQQTPGPRPCSASPLPYLFAALRPVTSGTDQNKSARRDRTWDTHTSTCDGTCNQLLLLLLPKEKPFFFFATLKAWSCMCSCHHRLTLSAVSLGLAKFHEVWLMPFYSTCRRFGQATPSPAWYSLPCRLPMDPTKEQAAPGPPVMDPSGDVVTGNTKLLSVWFEQKSSRKSQQNCLPTSPCETVQLHDMLPLLSIVQLPPTTLASQQGCISLLICTVR